MAILKTYNPSGVLMENEKVYCYEPIVINSVIYYRGFVNNKTSKAVAVSSSSYGVWTGTGKTGTKLSVSLVGVPGSTSFCVWDTKLAIKPKINAPTNAAKAATP